MRNWFILKAEDVRRVDLVTGVRTCVLRSSTPPRVAARTGDVAGIGLDLTAIRAATRGGVGIRAVVAGGHGEVGRAAWWGREEISGVGGSFKKKKNAVTNSGRITEAAHGESV